MRTFVILGLLAFTFQNLLAAEAPYYRFWRGYKRAVHVKEKVAADGSVVRDEKGFKVFEDDPARPMSWSQFKTLVNRWLIPATTSCCAQSSLVAYLPALLRKGDKPAKLHDEIALIVYRSEDAYKKTREDKENIEAVTYGPLHGDVFAMGDGKSQDAAVREQTSRSLVPVPFKGTVDLTPNTANNFLTEVAYDVLETAPDWQHGYTLFRVTLASETGEPETWSQYLSEVKAAAKASHLSGYLVLITKNYAIEYQNFENEAAAKAFAQKGQAYLSVAAEPKSQEPTKQALRYERLNFGHAATIRFPPGVKPTPAQRHHRLD